MKKIILFLLVYIFSISAQDIPDNLLGGAGFGFRYNTPIGPIRFDIAFKLDRKYLDFESPYVWYLTLGQAF